MLWEISWVNLTLLLATIPQYESAEDKKEDPDNEHEAETPDDLRNFLNL